MKTPRLCEICQKPLQTKHKSTKAHAGECAMALRSKQYFDANPKKEEAPKAKTVPEVITVEQEHRLKRENARLRKDLDQAIEAKMEAERFGTFIGDLEGMKPHVPDWVRNAVSTKTKRATPTLFLSDQHFGETVHPEQIEWLNAYDRTIAERRLKNFFQNSITIARDYLRGMTYDGIVLAIGGDSFSGDIHEELLRTNAGPIQEELLHWIEPTIAGIKLLADEFGKVFVPCVVGNHPRGTMKPSHKMRVPNNFDWLFMKLVEKFLAHDRRITFAVSQAADFDYSVFGTRYRLSHGDQFRGGSGIAGLLSPLMIGDARKRKRSQATGTEYDWLLLGHWHQRSKFKRIMVNGSLKGYDEYAYHANFDFELPLQSFWITDPKHGVTLDAPIHVMDKSEKWLERNALLRGAA